ncbi:armadillo-type protein [Syncephalastrum racemosum]|uniref:Armadillo-type protein n=1 Tax=Syncephalastrum racemosum TaxID=13706 RepID=A0A1X2HLM4_SYNRA|nr:armadillo-type protein [Syncephalastrum racemosum]
MEEERAHRIIETIPFMSKQIVDDTIYEKILSFLDSFLVRDPNHVLLFQSWKIFDALTQACAQEDPDYRVLTLCFRLVGRIVAHAGEHRSTIFGCLRNHSILLDDLVRYLASPHPALRCACLQAISGLLTSDEGIQWVLKNDHTKMAISTAFLDDTTYIVNQVSLLFRQVVEGADQNAGLRNLRDILNPVATLRVAMQPDSDSLLIMRALEFCWVMADSRTQAASDFLETEGLLLPILPLLDRVADDRMLSAKLTDVLTSVFAWVHSPLKLLTDDPSVDSEGVAIVFSYFCKLSCSKVLEPRSLDEAAFGMSLLSTTLTLLSRLDATSHVTCYADVADAFHLMIHVLYLCGRNDKAISMPQLQEALGSGFRRSRNEKALTYDALSALESMIHVAPATASRPECIECIMETLENTELTSDRRVVKSALKVAIVLLHHLADSPDVKNTVSQLVKRLVSMLDDMELDCYSIKLTFGALAALLEHTALGTLLINKENAKQIVSSITLKSMDSDWDTRDTAVEFIGGLFKQPLTRPKLDFALANDLPMLVVKRLHDDEAYVRAAAVDMLQNMMRIKEGWEYIQQKQSVRTVAEKLPSLLYDDEPQVRRATLDAIGCLIINHSCEGMSVGGSEDEKSLNRQIVSHLMVDPDPEVTIRMCRVGEHLWDLHLHEKEQQKRNKTTDEATLDQSQSLFYLLGCDTWLLEATQNTQRLVRAEAYAILQRILSSKVSEVRQRKSTHKRQVEIMDEGDEDFLNRLDLVDMAALRRNIDPEHLYQEALDIDVREMTHSTERGPGEYEGIPDCE